MPGMTAEPASTQHAPAEEALDPARFRGLPSVERLASDASLSRWGSPPAARAAARIAIDEARAAVAAGVPQPAAAELVAATAALLERWLSPGPQRVINATGVILHTNLGRAPLSDAARAALAAAAGYCAVEFDLESVARSSRQEHLRPLLRAVSGAEDGLAVTNNAAAIFLVLRALCHRREVLLSRGEAVAIGDGFRIPSIVATSGVRLVDVGTTNRTTVDDYRSAITDRTVAILRVHPSNFTISGFAERPSIAECAELAHARNLLLIDDVGSGWLDMPDGLRQNGDSEPVVRDVVAAGAGIVTCSADKLCGGPQAGLIFASTTTIEKLRRHPMARVVRPDKLVVAALAATLAGYVRGTAAEELPVLRMMTLPLIDIERRARAWCTDLQAHGLPAAASPSASAVGGGALPAASLPTLCVTLPDRAGALHHSLARQQPPVVGRVVRGRLWLDPRTVDPTEDEIAVSAVMNAWAATGTAAT